MSSLRLRGPVALRRGGMLLLGPTHPAQAPTAPTLASRSAA